MCMRASDDSIFHPQVRTIPILILDENNQTVEGNATRFSAMALKQGSSETLQFMLEDPTDCTWHFRHF